VLERAQAISASKPTQLSSAVLLHALMDSPDGVIASLLSEELRTEACERVLAGIPATAPGSSDAYEEILRTAETRARVDGAALVMEHHLLRALLGVQSPRLDRALAAAGLERDGLHAVMEQVLGVRYRHSTFGG
jgi:hypothetical protein